MARILIVDDVAALRDLVRIRLEEAAHRIVGEAADGRAAIEQAARLQPDVIVLDVEMPERTGLDALPEIRRASPTTRVLVFSGMPELTIELVRASGGHGLLRKRDETQLAEAVERVLRGRAAST